MKVKSPSTYLVGYTTIHMDGLRKYLTNTGQRGFLKEIDAALESGLQLGEILCSFYAKLCYKSLVLGENDNITKTRSVEDNIKSCFDVGHGSVFEHCVLNFVTTNCSRVFTHELVRHRVGTAFSQTSGRYVALDELDLVLPPEMANNVEVMNMIRDHVGRTEDLVRLLRERMIPDDASFADKKRITSAIRRLAPNGQVNEIGWSANIRALRHMINMRTSRAAEYEIRVIFGQVADIILDRFPMILHGAVMEEVDGLMEYRL